MDNNVEEKLRSLSEAYAAQLPNKIKEIEDSWEKIKKKYHQDELTILLRLAHTLGGTSGTYGYRLISDSSRQLEIKVKSLEENPQSEELHQQIEGLIIELKQLVLKPAEESPSLPKPIKVATDKQRIYVLLKDAGMAQSQLDKLQQINYEIFIFISLTSFFNAIEKDRPDLVIIDIEFAQEFSRDATAKLRDEMILIVFTAKKDDLEDRIFTVRHGGQAFIAQPFDINTLTRILDNLFEARQLGNERILIVDDSEFLSDYYSMILEHAGMITKTLNNPQDFLVVLQEFQPDLILMDVNMPFCSGTELAQIVNQQESLSGLPIVFLSSIAEKAKQLEVLNLAGDDFLTKPIDPKHLLAVVRSRLIRSRVLRSRMMRDSLTNLYNHTMIQHQLERELTLSARHHRDLCIALFDIDHFKKVNDTYGHQAGDKILKELSTFLQTNLRKSDLIGRYGGEEFLLVLPNTNEQTALKLMDKLRRNFSAMSHVIEDKTIKVSFSGGISHYPTFKKASKLVKVADEALYAAKEQGRNKIVLASGKSKALVK